MSDITFSVVPVSHKREQYAGEPGRERQQDDERIDERAELRDQNQIQQQHREQQADAETAERRAHALHHAAQGDVRRPSGAWCRRSIRVDCIRDRAQILAERPHVDIDRAADLIVIDFGGAFDALDAADHVEARRTERSRRRAAEWSAGR